MPRAPLCLLVTLIALSAPVLAAPPAEIDDLQIDQSATLSWAPAGDADTYNVYRGLVSELAAGNPPRCLALRLEAEAYPLQQAPAPGSAFAYLVTGQSGVEEGSAGSPSSGGERALLGACEPMMRHHILDRLGYGWAEWNADRLDALGWQGYLDEQLNPLSIDESANNDLYTRATRWGSPDDQNELFFLRNAKQLYAWRQLERVVVEFWQNHFSTYFLKTFEHVVGPLLGNFERAIRNSADIHLREEDAFRDVAFTGTFREMLETSTLSAAMMIYLDNVVNVAGAPNENYARELLELHAQGVDKGYTQQDVEELARVFTGWEVCVKPFAVADDPLAACTDPVFGEAGRWVANFNVANHDSGQKILFAGTPYETVIPDTSGNPNDGVNDVDVALDAIAARPETAEFIATKLLRRFITDTPTPEMIASVVQAWNDTGGNLQSVYTAVLDPQWLFDPRYATEKLKNPQEHVYSAYRALRGKTDPTFAPNLLVNWINRLGHLPYYRVSPDGYPDVGAAWISANGLLDRQDMGLAMSNDFFFYGTQVNQMVAEQGLSSAEEIVDFFSGILFGGAITPQDRQRAIDYLNTDALGNPSPYDDARVRETVGFMLGFVEFNER
jgi:uncharacterized protein (DUF1800 family)